MRTWLEREPDGCWMLYAPTQGRVVAEGRRWRPWGWLVRVWWWAQVPPPY